MYALRTMISDARGLLEIESGTARRVAIQAMSGKAIPNTTSTTTAADDVETFVAQKRRKRACIKKQAADQNEIPGKKPGATCSVFHVEWLDAADRPVDSEEESSAVPAALSCNIEVVFVPHPKKSSTRNDSLARPLSHSPSIFRAYPNGVTRADNACHRSRSPWDQ